MEAFGTLQSSFGAFRRVPMDDAFGNRVEVGPIVVVEEGQQMRSPKLLEIVADGIGDLAKHLMNSR